MEERGEGGGERDLVGPRCFLFGEVPSSGPMNVDRGVWCPRRVRVERHDPDGEACPAAERTAELARRSSADCLALSAAEGPGEGCADHHGGGPVCFHIAVRALGVHGTAIDLEHRLVDEPAEVRVEALAGVDGRGRGGRVGRDRDVGRCGRVVRDGGVDGRGRVGGGAGVVARGVDGRGRRRIVGNDGRLGVVEGGVDAGVAAVARGRGAAGRSQGDDHAEQRDTKLLDRHGGTS